MQNKDICDSCKYRKTCRQDMMNLFAKSKRTGASLVNVLVFFLVALMLTAQAFFFLENSAESMIEEREMMQVRLQLDELIDEAKEALKTIDPHLSSVSVWGSYKTVYGKTYAFFSDTSSDVTPGAKTWERDNVCIFDLYYTMMNNNDLQREFSDSQEKKEVKNLYRKIYPALGKNYFLIRARKQLSAGNYIMRQVVIEKSGSVLYTHSSEEVFYW